MSDSSGDSDCFESADEGINDDDVPKRDNVTVDSDRNNSSRTESTSSSSFGDGDGKKVIDGNGNPKSSVQYRKRPERSKNLPKEAMKPPNNIRKVSLGDQIFKADIMKPDVLIQDISSNFSKNLNKGFNTIQQTSSSIKGLVLSSLPVNVKKETSDKFLYDEEHVTENEDKSNIPNEHHSNFTSELEEHNEESVHLEEKEEMRNICLEIQSTHTAEPTRESVELDYNEECLEKEDTENETMKNSDAGDAAKEIHMQVTAELICENEKLNVEPVVDIECQAESNANIGSSSPENLHDIDGVDETKQIDIVDAEATNINDGWDSAEIDLDELENENTTCSDNVPGENAPEIVENANDVAEEEDAKADDNDGWDDFDIDDEEIDDVVKSSNIKPVEHTNKNNYEVKQDVKCNANSGGQGAHSNEKTESTPKWSGWEHFGEKQDKKTGWNLGGWGVNALINTASSVTQGISNVLEAGLGAPDPVLLARMENQLLKEQRQGGHNEGLQDKSTDVINEAENKSINKNEDISPSLNIFPVFGITNLVAGVTNKLVENTKVHEISSRVLSGGLDTLESVGRKTMEVLQDGDPGLKKKRALLLGLDKPVLSQVLREAKTKAEMEDRKLEEKQMAKRCHFETLFDDFKGLIHLEALEMLSTQCELKLDQIKSSLPSNEVDDLIGIIDEVKELCIIDENEFKSNYLTMVDFKMSLSKAVEPLKNEISIVKINEVYEDTDAWLKREEKKFDTSAQNILQKAISAMAELTAATVQQFHKGGELLSVKEHRKTVEEADVLLQITGFLCGEINHTSERFLKLKSTENLSKADLEAITKAITSEAKNATSYIKDAFNLLIPVLQLGAAT